MQINVYITVNILIYYCRYFRHTILKYTNFMNKEQNNLNVVIIKN
jgi:hypothetical protein